MKSLFAVLFSLIIFAGAGCSPASWSHAERAFKAGDMVAAVRYAVQTLREEPGYADAVDFLALELPRSYDNYNTRAQRAERAGDWDEAYNLYGDILAMSDAVRGLPPQIHEDTKQTVTFATRDVESEYQNARKRAAEKHYNAGLSYEGQGMAKDAAKEFSRALDYIDGYEDAAQRYEKNRQAAVKRIAVMPFDNLSGKRYYGAIGTVVADRLISDAMSNPGNMEFLEFVTRENINELISEHKFEQSSFVDPTTTAQFGKLLGIHAFVFGKITSITTDYSPDMVATYEEKDEISQGKDKPTKKVRAAVTVITRRATARFNCSYQIVDVNRGTIVKSGNVPRTEIVEIRFGRYKGIRRR